MGNKIISVIPVERIFSLTWRLTKRCNYDCMYCPPEWHDNFSKHLKLEEMQKVWDEVFSKTQHLGLKYKISFTGGEVTSNKHFKDFVLWLRTNYGGNISKILVTTNGSATTKYYKMLYEHVDNISFSIHSEFIDEQKFFDMIGVLRKWLGSSDRLHINIMNEYWNESRIPLYKQLLASLDINHSVNDVNYSKQIRTYPINLGKLNLDTK